MLMKQIFFSNFLLRGCWCIAFCDHDRYPDALSSLDIFCVKFYINLLQPLQPINHRPLSMGGADAGEMVLETPQIVKNDLPSM